MKTCSKCGEEKPEAAFYKKCQSLEGPGKPQRYQAEYARQHPEKKAAQTLWTTFSLCVVAATALRALSF